DRRLPPAPRPRRRGAPGAADPGARAPAHPGRARGGAARVPRVVLRGAPVPRADARGAALAPPAPGVGGQPARLPARDPAQGRRDHLQLPRPRRPPRVAAAHRGPRRARGGRGRHRAVGAARRVVRRAARGDGGRAPRAPRGAHGGGVVRDVLQDAPVGRRRRVVAHRAVRARHHAPPPRVAPAPLPLDRRRGLRLLQVAPRAGAARQRPGARRRARPLHHGGEPAARLRRAALQDRDALGAHRRRAQRLPRV
ncbi:MAG: Pyrroloquinoline-quinone synthase, partial [uncultured Gemmatimonadaceae bacterium]